IYGNSALYQIMSGQSPGLVAAVSADTSVALFQFLEAYPLPLLTSAVATLLVVVFFVTSADSGALVIDMLSSRGEEQSPVWQRIFWALMVGAIAIALLIAGGLEALQAGTIASAFPFTFVMLLVGWGLLGARQLDVAKRQTTRAARPTAPGRGAVGRRAADGAAGRGRAGGVAGRQDRKRVPVYLRHAADGLGPAPGDAAGRGQAADDPGRAADAAGRCRGRLEGAPAWADAEPDPGRGAALPAGHGAPGARRGRGRTGPAGPGGQGGQRRGWPGLARGGAWGRDGLLLLGAPGA